ncbi:MAG: zinc ABC transporter substrate-binding protein, partial [Rhodospirillales bacterium]|nr:zinc ABC transporter substrate-binding protein [Rhodospirillales bacterium]
MRPSEARALERAQLVVWVGEGLETFLEKPLASLGGKARIVEMAALPGIRLLKPRQGGAWDIHPGHEHEHGHDGEEAYDSHLWLDVDNARILVAALAGELAALDPAHAQAFIANAARVTARLEALDGDLRTRLSGVTRAPFLVFHDSYQYFEARYGLNA